RRVLDEQPPEARVLDPACGSGTFLYHTIRYKIDALAKTRVRPGPAELLDLIQQQVVGIDVHPLAVIIARANYLLALGELLPGRRATLTIPVYLADSIRKIRDATQSPGRYPGLPVLRVRPDPKEDVDIFVPMLVGADPVLLDQVVDACRDYAARHAADGRLQQQAFERFIRQRVARLPEDGRLAKALFDMACGFAEFIRRRRDTIQAYVLKNMLKPIFLKGGFHVVLGNPPWLSYRYIRAPEYQRQVADLLEEYGLPSRGHLATHMELATLFFLRCADWYLGERGTIAFVQPRSIFSADQHGRLREGEFTKPALAFVEAWDLEGVAPLFNVPAAVLIAEKRPGACVRYPIRGLRLSGSLPRRNASRVEAAKALRREEVSLHLHRAGRRSHWSDAPPMPPRPASAYGRHFAEGATIVPRPLWFVERVVGPLGIDEARPPVRTDPDIYDDAKRPWNAVHMEGQMEARFLYEVVLSKDVVPFGIIQPHLAVLPVLPEAGKYRILTAEEASDLGYELLAEWLARAEEHWERGRAAKAKLMSITERLDRYHGVTSQPSPVAGTGGEPRGPKGQVRLLMPMSGSILTAAVLSDPKVVVDYTLFWSAMAAPAAHYLAAVCNSLVTTSLVEPMMTRGQWGARHFCKKVWELPIPVFDESDAIHRQLCELGRHCAERVAAWLAAETSAPSDSERRAKVAALRRNLGRTRQRVREYIADELEEIDRLVGALLSGR
ncbi:MAG: hypothetical protein H5T86_09550, partial [Armatimonadetes bacterium]|nr:hypothetical protein [Armatimonadota bacterium]